MNNRMKCDEYSIANNLPGVDSRRVFNFLNRVFDSMKMHTAAQKVYITGVVWEKRKDVQKFGKANLTLNRNPKSSRLSKMLDGKERE